MHLLDATTKRLKTFYGKEIPQYAILSHMWGKEEDEVLFRHITGSDSDRDEGEMRKGYAKIKMACKQAIEDGWKYIWIDTCCIDKGSSAELSEAINSMYEWYRNSEVCYVYLEDVQSDGDVQSGNNSAGFPIVPFERSRWFSRGWTLQELIAPQYVVFYSKNWTDIGTKIGLRDTVSAVTRIRIEMLTAYDPRQASVAEKMSWAAFRETTRSEDVAYCLMGLLGVNMPLLYGEGNRAFRRLQEEIMKVSDDDSLFAWKSRIDNYKYLGSTQGMLADSPWDFRDGINIVRSANGAYSPYSMTNQGLQIKLPLLPVDSRPDLIGIESENVFKTILKCTIRNIEPTRWIVIYLKITGEGQYQRIFPHWLDETGANPNELNPNELTSLLVPQVDISTIYNRQKIRGIEIEILPTASGFTTNGRMLEKGYKYPFTIKHDTHKVVRFNRQGKQFRVTIGLAKHIPWVDYTHIIDEEWWNDYSPYEEGGSRHDIKAHHLDQLSERIPGENWWVTVSVRKTGHGQDGPYLRAFIDIQRVPIRAKGWHIPSVMSAHDSFSGNFPDDLDHHNVHPNFKKESRDWFAVFNPRLKRLFDIGLLYTLRHERVVDCVQFSYDGKYLATSSNIVRVYYMETGAEICTLIDESTKKSGHRHGINSICFSPNNEFLATGDTDGNVKLWDIGEKRIHKVLSGHQKAVNSLCFTSNAHLIISGSKDGTVRIWDIADGTSRILTMDHLGVRSVAISPNGKLVAAGSSNGTIRIWDIGTTQPLAVLRAYGNYLCITFTSDGKGLVSGGTDRTLKYWDVSKLVPTEGKWIAERNVVGKVIQSIMAFTGHRDSIKSVSQNGQWVVSGSNDGDVLFCDLTNGSVQFILAGRARPIRSVNISPVGNIFATAYDGMVQVWRQDDI